MRRVNEETLLSRMTLRDKIGQMLLVGFHGTDVPEELRSLITEGRIGGVILFARNVESPAQVARLTASLQRAAAEAGVPPLWISIDQEGGMVARLTEGVALMPGNMALGATDDPSLAYEAALVAGLELCALGINMNYAPVLDVNNNPANPVIGVRSYGESPERVAAFGAEAIRGYSASGVAATAKHFPGHGDTSVDSHLDLPLVGHDRERLDRVELAPFRRAIEAGVDLIMTAHVRFPAIEPNGLPATLSTAVLTGLLREELGFDGVITTDCMEMKAIADHYGTREAAVLTVAAGADQVLVSHTVELQRGALAAIEAAVADGRIPPERIEAAARRSLRLKAARGVLTASGAPAASFDEVGSEAHLAVARDISERSVTLVRNERGALPLQDARTLVVTVAAVAQTIADEAVRASAGLGAALASLGLDCRDEVVDSAPSEARIAALAALAREGGWAQLVVGVYNAAFHPAQARLVRELQATGLPLVVAALRNPYDLALFPDVDGYVAVYENRPLSLMSAAKALLGRIPFRGALPVSLGDAYPAGWRGETR
ncbi:beta-N-acetylhexosaminidase [Paenibacillus antri]|uniref:Beta-N-acetylhexosaminidase n=1 Tax=Paenibacillus antri TaxID=2582848 RepID=A0A5R9G565_9BACL|nr:beta-N-acetylhexosaminidase [Paenibacillus antri]TLS50921.1 beta-N-acetylhexosaminidase [Paenibacillus antri]